MRSFPGTHSAAPAESSQGRASFLGGGRRAGVIGPVCTQGALVSRFPLIRAALCPSATASPTPWPGARTGAQWGSEVELSRWCPAATDTCAIRPANPPFPCSSACCGLWPFIYCTNSLPAYVVMMQPAGSGIGGHGPLWESDNIFPSEKCTYTRKYCKRF